MGSVMSFLALPVGSPYAMSKHAVRALAGALRAEVAKYGVGVTLLAPGFVDSQIRKVDNQGRYHEDAGERIPGWLRMDTDKAAAKLVRAVIKRKRVAVITLHGKLVVFLERHVPWLVSFLVHVLGIQKRRHREV
jgi:short-subunit dehydrogenase